MENRITRKQFLQVAGAAALTLPVVGLYGHPFSPLTPPASSYAAHPGLQLYTLRESFGKDPEGTLKRVAAIGFKDLEFFNPGSLGMSGMVKDLGMTIISSHFSPGYITGSWDKKFFKTPPTETFESLVETCAKNGVKNLGIGMLFPSDREHFDDYKRFAETANKAGEKSKKAGVQLYYHNHSFEFEPVENTTPLEAMLAIMDPSLVQLELDVFWTTVSGNDASAWIRKLKGRIKFLHLKDLKAGTPKDYTTFKVDHAAFVALGEGMVDFKKILQAAHETGIPYTFVEQDYSVIDPFESITKSIGYLKGLGI